MQKPFKHVISTNASSSFAIVFSVLTFPYLRFKGVQSLLNRIFFGLFDNWVNCLAEKTDECSTMCTLDVNYPV